MFFIKYKWKISCGLLGFLFELHIKSLSGIGLFLGYCIGLYFDNIRPRNSNTALQIFLRANFRTMGYFAKMDGHVSQNTIDVAEKIMVILNLNKKEKELAKKLFMEGKNARKKVIKDWLFLSRFILANKKLLNYFLVSQFNIIRSESVVSNKKKNCFNAMLIIIGCPYYNFDFLANYINHESEPFETDKSSSASGIAWAYRTLQSSSDESTAEVKKKYRKLISAHHPDRLIAQGLDDAAIKKATQKTQEIKKAFQILKEYRGFK